MVEISLVFNGGMNILKSFNRCSRTFFLGLVGIVEHLFLGLMRIVEHLLLGFNSTSS